MACLPGAQVELAPLPAGVPERLPVSCNGRSAVFLVRCQRVLFGGDEMTPSRFEHLAGRGDAKKWKTSIITGSRVRLYMRHGNTAWRLYAVGLRK